MIRASGVPVLASLNHPNIGAIYDFQEEGDTQFLVMELTRSRKLREATIRLKPDSTNAEPNSEHEPRTEHAEA